MAVATLDAAELGWEQHATVATLRIRPSGDHPEVSATTLRFRVDGGRVRVGLLLLDGHRDIDVSIQPAFVTRAVGGEGRGATAAAEQVCRWVAAFAAANGAWRPEDPAAAGVSAVVGGASFPLLGAAMDQGAAPLDEVPRWATAVLAAPTARAAAQAAFPARATRPVVAALAAALVSGVGPDGSSGGGTAGAATVALFPLALATMAPALGPDRLARVLGATEPWRGPAAWPEVDLVADAARLTPHLGEQRTERLLLDAAHLESGPALLADAVQAYGLVRHRAGRRLPNRLVEFREHCRALLPPDPNPLGVVAPTRRRSPGHAARPAVAPPVVPRVAPPPPPPPAPPVPTAAERRRAMLRAPRTQSSHVPEHLPLVHPPPVTALIGRQVRGGVGEPLRFVVPRTAAELTAWGDRLHNCVGGFGPAVNERRSIVVGIESGDRLAYCIEVRPDGVIRQFLGAHNRPVPRPDALPVVQALAAAGVVRADATDNGHWFEPC